MKLEEAIKIGRRCTPLYKNGLFIATNEIKLSDVIKACKIMADRLAKIKKNVGTY